VIDVALSNFRSPFNNLATFRRKNEVFGLGSAF
jgi:hypothetical protein